MTSKKLTTRETIGDVYCYHNSCNGVKCEVLDGHRTTLRSFYDFIQCRVQSLIHKYLSRYNSTRRLPKQKHTLSMPKEMDLLHGNPMFVIVLNESTKLRKEQMFNLYVDSKVQKFNTEVCCPKCKNKKCDYISTSQTSSSYECQTYKPSCHVLLFWFGTDFFGGDGTNCFAKKRNCNYETPSPLLKKFHRQSQSTTTRLESKNFWMRIL